MNSITILLSHEIHPVSARAIATSNDERALALAINCMGVNNIRALTAGFMPESAARGFLAQGIARIERLALKDAESMAQTLSSECQDAKWIVTGVQTAQGSGLLPYSVANILQRPIIDRVVSIRVDGDALHVEQALSKGARRHLTLTSSAILTIHPQAAVDLRYAANFAANGQIMDHGVLEPAAIERSDWLNVKNHARTILKPNIKKSGHSRMLSAIGDSTGQTSAQIINTPDANVQARAVLDYLHQHGLLN